MLSQLLKRMNSNEISIQRLFATPTGRGFEQIILDELTKNGTIIIIDVDQLKKDGKAFSEFKASIINLDEFEPLKNFWYKKMTIGRTILVKEPFGSQSYPDLVLINNNYVLPIELKFSTQYGDRPVWNSGLPRQNGIYLFGSYMHRRSTFFKGSSLLQYDQIKLLVETFDKAEKFLKNIFEENKQEFKNMNFDVYLRRMYNQKTSLFADEELKQNRENEAILYVEKLGF